MAETSQAGRSIDVIGRAIAVTIFILQSPITTALGEVSDQAPLTLSCIQEPNAECLVNAAVKFAAQTDDQTVLSSISHNLALTGRFDEAGNISNRLKTPWQRKMAEQAIAVRKISIAARNDPNTPINFLPIEHLAEISDLSNPSVEVTGGLYILALDLLERHPFSNGGNSDIVSLEKSSSSRTSINPPPALKRVVERLASLIPTLPEQFREHAWLNLAEIMIDIDDKVGAQVALTAAAVHAKFPNLIAQQWLRLDDETRAMGVMADNDGHWAPTYIAVAKRMIDRGAEQLSIVSVLRKAFVDASIAVAKTKPNFELERQIVQMEQTIANKADADRMTSIALEQARLPAMFKATNLASVAAIFIDQGDLNTARSVLVEAVNALPKDEHAIIGRGVVSGPISASTWHVGDGMKTAVAVQYYRIGEYEKFNSIISNISREYHWDTWKALISDNLPSGIKLPSIELMVSDVLPEQRTGLLVDIAAISLRQGYLNYAKELLETVRQLTGVSIGPKDFGALWNLARIEFVQGRRDLAKAACQKMAQAAAATFDPGHKAQELSKIAEFISEILVN